jgi:uncharacterized phage infection (PIP) family protein YhgE
MKPARRVSAPLGKGPKLTDKAQNLAQRVQKQTQHLLDQLREQVLKEQALECAQDFHRQSLGSLEGRLRNDRSQLEDLLRRLPSSQEYVREQVEQLVASYEAIEDSLDRVAVRQGAEDSTGWTSEEIQQTPGQITHQAQEVDGQAAKQTREAGAGERESLEAGVGEEEIRIPVIEEQIVVEKRPMVKEVIRVRKKIVEEEKVVEQDVRREEVDIDEQIERNDGRPFS